MVGTLFKYDLKVERGTGYHDPPPTPAHMQRVLGAPGRGWKPFLKELGSWAFSIYLCEKGVVRIEGLWGRKAKERGSHLRKEEVRCGSPPQTHTHL